MVVAWLPDTNVWIAILKNPQNALAARIQACPPSEIFFCSIVKAELWHGAEKYGNREHRLKLLSRLFAPFQSLTFTDEAAQHYASIRHELELAGGVIGPNDLKIAAIARANSLTVVTSNTTEFSRVSGLRVENWG